MGCVLPYVPQISLLAGHPPSLVHLVECLGRARNALRETMKHAETDLAAVLADEILSQNVSTVSSLREQMADVHRCRGVLRTFATEILASDDSDRDFDASVLFVSDPSSGLAELESLRESRRVPGARGSREGRNYDDLSRVRTIFEGVRRENRSITKEWIRSTLPPGSSVVRREIPLLDSPVFIGVPGEMVQLTTVEVMAVLDVAGGGGCYPDSSDSSESESEADEPGAEDVDMDVDEFGSALAIDAAPEAYVCDLGAGVVRDSKPFKAFNLLLRKMRRPKGDGVAILGTVGAAGTGVLKTHLSFGTEFGRYVSSVGLGRFYVVEAVTEKVSRHTVDVSSWSEAQREDAISFVETYRGPVVEVGPGPGPGPGVGPGVGVGPGGVRLLLACADSDSDSDGDEL